MGKARIQDEAEVVRWFTEGRTYGWMVEEHDRKYNMRLSPSAFSNFRVRKGLARRIAREPDLIPWEINCRIAGPTRSPCCGSRLAVAVASRCAPGTASAWRAGRLA